MVGMRGAPSRIASAWTRQYLPKRSRGVMRQRVTVPIATSFVNIFAVKPVVSRNSARDNSGFVMVVVINQIPVSPFPCLVFILMLSNAVTNSAATCGTIALP
jgi:hypothetical protein